MKKIGLIISFLIIASFMLVSTAKADEQIAVPITSQTFIKIAEEAKSKSLAGELHIVLTPKPTNAKERQEKNESYKSDTSEYDRQYPWETDKTDKSKHNGYPDEYYDKYGGGPSVNGNPLQTEKDSSVNSLREQLKQLQKKSRQNNKNTPTKKKNQKKEEKWTNYYKPKKQTHNLGNGILIDKNGLFLSIISGNSRILDGISGKEKEYDITFQITVGNKPYPAELISIQGKFTLWRAKELQNTQLKLPMFSKNTQAQLGQMVIILGKENKNSFIKIGHISSKKAGGFYIDSYGWDYRARGALVLNLKKEIIGIVQEGYTQIKAVPISQTIIAQLIKSSKKQDVKKKKSWIGIELVQLTKKTVDYLKYHAGLNIWQEKGVIVREYSDRGTPAYQAGIKQGDIVKSIDDKPINDLETARKLIEEIKPGQILIMEIINEINGQKRIIKIKTIEKKFYHYFFKSFYDRCPGEIL